MIVKLPAQLLKVESRSDRTYKLTFNTMELNGEVASALLNEIMNQGWLMYSPNSFNEDEVPKEKADAGLGVKTPSQRMRAVIFLIHSQSDSKLTFEEYYKQTIESIITQLKEKIED